MSESNMKNVATMSAQELLLDWKSGMGASGKTPEQWQHVETGKLHGKAISLALLTAIAELKTTDTTVSFDVAIEKGYLSPNHQAQYESASKQGGSIGKTKTANITAEQYKVNCIKLGLDVAHFEHVASLVDSALSVTDKSTKAELMQLLEQFVAVFFNTTQQQTYTSKVEAEEAARVKFEALVNSGFTAINELVTGRYVATLQSSNIANVAILADHGFTMIGVNSTDGKNYQVTFKDVEQTEVVS